MSHRNDIQLIRPHLQMQGLGYFDDALPLLVKHQVQEKIEQSKLPVCVGRLKNGIAIFADKSGVMTGNGPLFRIKSITNKCGQRIQIRMPLAGTATALVRADHAIEMKCLHAYTGEVLLFCGVLLNNADRNEETNRSARTNKIASHKAQPNRPRPMKTNQNGSSKRAGKPRVRNAAHNGTERMAELAAAYRAGLNPDLKIGDLIALLQESSATIYRKISKKLFPPPIKRGRGSFWTMQDVLAYKEGNWNKGAAK